MRAPELCVVSEEVPPPKRRLGLRIDPSDLLLEIVSVVVAILLALAVNEWRDGLQRQQRAHAALPAIRSEMTNNRAQLLAVMPHHLAVQRAFDGLANGAASRQTMDFGQFVRAFGKADPNGYIPFSGESTAWELARTSSVLTDVDYATRVTLERAYGEQAFLAQAGDHVIDHVRFGPVPERANFYPDTVSFAADATDVVYAERRLLQRYDAALHALGAASM
jgi:hypothetical protein